MIMATYQAALVLAPPDGSGNLAPHLFQISSTAAAAVQTPFSLTGANVSTYSETTNALNQPRAAVIIPILLTMPSEIVPMERLLVGASPALITEPAAISTAARFNNVSNAPIMGIAVNSLREVGEIH